MNKPIMLVTNDIQLVGKFQKIFTQIDCQTLIIYVREVLEAIDYFLGVGIYGEGNSYPLPKILFLELNLSEGLGLKFLEWLKSQPKFKDTAFVGLSQSLNQEYKQIFSNYGLDFLIDLPLSEELFLELIKSVYRNLTQEQDLKQQRLNDYISI